MADDIIRIVFDRTNKIESTKVKKPTGISAIGNNYRRRDENNKKSFKKALVNAKKEIKTESEKLDDTEDVIISSSLANLIEENSKIGSILQEKITNSSRLNEILRDKSEKSCEPLENIERGKNSEN